jgi:hypothetical protein
METIKIYSLENAKTGEIRYIGYTKKSLEERLKKHLNNVNEAFNLKRRKINKRLSWIKSINCEVTITELDNGTINDIIWMEQYYISQFKAWGFNLTNGTDGGDGGNTFVKLSEKGKQQFRNKLSKALKGRINGPLSDEHKLSLKKNHAISNGKIINPSLNKLASPEAKEKMRLAKLNSNKTPNFTKRIYNIIEQYDRNGILLNTFNSLDEAILQFNLLTKNKYIKSNINRSIDGKQAYAYNFKWKSI